MFSSTVPITALIPWCRALRHGLGVGLSPPHVFRQQATRGPMALRAVAARVAERLEAGESLADALAPERDRFPTLFLDMVGIGESTGHLPEVCGELENYCTLQLQMRRKFISEITWPAFQFVVAILVIALLIWVLGMIAEAHNTEAIAPVGMGLTGAAGAVTFLMTAVAVVAGVYFGYRFLSRNVGRWAAVEAFLLRVPGIGPCLDALAMQRFCLSLRLTTEVGLPVHEAVRRSLRSTGNAAFIRAEDRAARALRSGRDLTTTLTRSGVFTEEFLQSLNIAEETGQIPEVMERQEKNYREEAARRLSALTRSASFGVWMIVAIFIIIAIFRIASIYFNALGSIG